MHARVLHAITTGRQSLDEVLRIASGPAFRDAVQAVHIREKHRPARELFEWAIALAETLGPDRIVVNDRIDVALAAGVGSVQLASHSLPPDAVRRQWPSLRFGCSVHSEAEARRAAAAGADYVLFGHVYETASKPGLAPRGTAELARVVSAVAVPVLAIGGITPERVAEVLAAGCAGIAVMSGIWESPDPESAARRFREALDAYPGSPPL